MAKSERCSGTMTALTTYWALLLPPVDVQSPLDVPLPPQALKANGTNENRLKMVRFMFAPRFRLGGKGYIRVESLDSSV
jgi:hypothetical protein